MGRVGATAAFSLPCSSVPAQYLFLMIPFAELGFFCMCKYCSWALSAMALGKNAQVILDKAPWSLS